MKDHNVGLVAITVAVAVIGAFDNLLAQGQISQVPKDLWWIGTLLQTGIVALSAFLPKWTEN